MTRFFSRGKEVTDPGFFWAYLCTFGDDAFEMWERMTDGGIKIERGRGHFNSTQAYWQSYSELPSGQFVFSPRSTYYATR